ncbi:hypothetical protein C8R43DRAFT_1119306 [Mycena crocata]|nr:hypothetical protein C8R43DRAFT_1119302 [Mycena crocata]KAJ7173909.1 hypothetical protein C8R43DRAFT_1119306 [Mycena crocata]
MSSIEDALSRFLNLDLAAPVWAVDVLRQLDEQELGLSVVVGRKLHLHLMQQVLVAEAGFLPSDVLSHWRVILVDSTDLLAWLVGHFNLRNKNGRKRGLFQILLHIMARGRSGDAEVAEWMKHFLAPAAQLAREYNVPRLEALASHVPVLEIEQRTLNILDAIARANDVALNRQLSRQTNNPYTLPSGHLDLGETMAIGLRVNSQLSSALLNTIRPQNNPQPPNSECFTGQVAKTPAPRQQPDRYGQLVAAPPGFHASYVFPTASSGGRKPTSAFVDLRGFDTPLRCWMVHRMASLDG